MIADKILKVWEGKKSIQAALAIHYGGPVTDELALYAGLVAGIAGVAPLELSQVLEWWTAGDPETLTIVDTDKVAEWRGKKLGLAMAQSTGASRPTFQPTGFGGGPCVYANNGPFLTLDSPPIPTGGASAEAWAICSQDLAVGTTGMRQVVCWGNAADASRGIGRNTVSSVNRAMVRTGTGSNNYAVQDTDVDFSSRHVIRGVWDGGLHQIWIDDDVTPGSESRTPATSTARLRFFGNAVGTPGQLWVGALADVLILDTAVAGADLDYLRGWALGRRNLA